MASTSVTNSDVSLDAISKIDGYNRNPSNPVPKLKDANECLGCDKPSSTIGLYTDCGVTGKLNYVEPILKSGQANMVKTLFAEASLDSNLISSACTKYLLEKPTVSARSADMKCLKPQPQSTKKTYSCVSESHHRLIHNSLSTVARCMKGFLLEDKKQLSAKSKIDGVDPFASILNDMLGLYSAESGLQFNALSPTGAKGIGQLTGIAIEDVNQKFFSGKNKLAEYFSKHAEGSCQNLAKIIEKPYSSNTNRCEKLSLNDGNPAKNLIYSFAYRKIQEGYIRNSFKNKFYKNKFSNTDLFEAFIQKSTTWAYNPGAGGYAVQAKKALDEFKKIESQSDLDRLMDRVIVAFTGKTKDQACGSQVNVKRKENGCYFNKIQKTLKDLNDKSGVQKCIKS